MESPSQPTPRQSAAKGPQTHGRKRGTACERCNRRRSRCDGWINGVPCSACRKSNNHAQCTLIQSKRWRGPDGRYTLRTGNENSSAASTMTASASNALVPVDEGRSNNNDGKAASSYSSDGGHDRATSQTTAESVERQPEEPQHEESIRSPSSVQPNFVGESWYASYVMRGFAPGHTSFHRPLDDCNQTVQSISREARNPHATSRAAPSRKITASPDLPPSSLMDRLIDVYFERFHAFCPILRKKFFFEAFNNKSISRTLLRSVLFVASLHCDLEIIHLIGYSTRLDANNDLFNKASASFDQDQESDRTNMVLSSYLLHYWFGNPTSYRDAHWWLAAAIRSAQCMGYHRSTKNSQMPPEEKSRWKRIWWCLYIRDRQTSLSTGTPMVINDLDHDVEELVAEDLPDESRETVQYILLQMELNKAASRLYFLHCSPSRLPLSSDTTVREEAMRDIQVTLETWYTTFQIFRATNANHHLTLTLEVCYCYYLINLHQRLQRQCHKSTEIKLVVDAALRVFSLVEDSLLYWSPEHFPMIYVSALFSAMMALAANGHNAPPKSDELLRKIRPGLLALKQFEPVYVLARWIRNFFMDILKRSESPIEHESQPPQQTTEISEINSGQPITPESVAYAPAANTGACAITPMSTDQPDYSTPSMLVGEAGFMLNDAADDSTPVTRGMGGFWPSSLMHGVFSSNHDSEMMDFPQPDSLQYQALYFLADLGIASSENI